MTIWFKSDRELNMCITVYNKAGNMGIMKWNIFIL